MGLPLSSRWRFHWTSPFSLMIPQSIICCHRSSRGRWAISASALRVCSISCFSVTLPSPWAHRINFGGNTTPVPDGDLNVGLGFNHASFVNGIAFLERATDGLVGQSVWQIGGPCQPINNGPVEFAQFEVF